MGTDPASGGGSNVEPDASAPMDAGQKAVLSVVVAGTGKGTVSTSAGVLPCKPDGACTLTVDVGVPITLSAVPDVSARFTGWTGACGKDPSCTLTPTADVTVVATFEPQVALTVDFQLDPDATSTVTSVPPGVNATKSGTTVAYFAPGTQVALTLSQPPGGESFRFKGACSGTNGGPNGTSCLVTLDTPKTVSVRAAHYNHAFVTSSVHTGNLGGLTGADAICNALAESAGLPGNYAAFLSATGIAAKSRVAVADGWRRTDNVAFIENKADAFATGSLQSSLDLDETGKRPVGFDPAFERTHTGSNAAGDGIDYAGESYCQSWTVATGQASQGTAVVSNRFWLSAGAGPCSAQRRFYCLGTSQNRPLVKASAPVGARRAFLSTASVTPSAGVASFDQVCKTEAAAATLANDASFLALVAPSQGVSAASRFDTTKGPWIGTDGVPLAATAALFMQQLPWRAGIHRHANGTPEPSQPLVLTGYRVSAALPTPRPDSPGNYTCTGWTSSASGDNAGFGQFGFSGHYGMSFGEAFFAGGTCDVATMRVYCLEN